MNNDSTRRNSQSRPQHRTSQMEETEAHKYPHRRKVRKRRVVIRKGKPVQKSRLGNWQTTVAALVTLVGATGLIVGGANLGIQLIVNPEGVAWVNYFLPEWTRIPVKVKEPPQTLAQIRAAVSQKGFIPGETLFLGGEPTASELLLPVLARLPNCQIDCEQIVELRVYQPTESSTDEAYYRLVSQVAIAGLEKSFVIAPLNNAESENQGSSSSLPLTRLSRFEGKVQDPGVWLNLTGKLQHGDTQVTYGQVLHYNPSHTHLSVMLSWTSPAGQAAYWQEVTDGDAPELVVNQTVGLEPKFRVYQLKPRTFVPDPVELEEISITETALDSQAYRDALMLARNGLWSKAWELLKSLKSKQWSDSAQAQMDLIGLHAQFTKVQSNKPWASPAEQVLAYLIDGRFLEALQVFQASEGTQRFEIVNLLKTDSGRLWKRIEAASKVDPNKSDLQAWGAMILAAKEGRPAASAWLQKLPPNTPETLARIYELLDQLEAPFATASPVTSHLSQIIGSALPVNQVNPADWLQPYTSAGFISPPLKLEEKQVWYQVQVSKFNDGQRWRQSPFADLNLFMVGSVKQLWKLLGLDPDPRIQITVWKPDGRKETTMATVKAAQIKDGVLQLLAAGEVLPGITLPDAKNPLSGVTSKQSPTPNSKLSSPTTPNKGEARLLAHTEKALQWLEPNPITLADLNQMQPQWVTLILPTLWSELQNARQKPPGPIPSLQEMLQSIGNLPVQPIDLTGNIQPEIILTLSSEKALQLTADSPSKKAGVKPSVSDKQMFRPRTMIFADTGAVIYSEFTTSGGQSLVAIADMGDGGLPALVLQGSSNYTLKRWSIERQRFE